jgi:hypothetical protein
MVRLAGHSHWRHPRAPPVRAQLLPTQVLWASSRRRVRTSNPCNSKCLRLDASKAAAPDVLQALTRAVRGGGSHGTGGSPLPLGQCP